MLGAHNDGVFRLEARQDLGEIVGWLVDDLDAVVHDVVTILASRQQYVEENVRLQDISGRAGPDPRGTGDPFAAYGLPDSRQAARETADFIKEALEGKGVSH